MADSNRVLIAALFLCLTGCASTSAEKIGSATYAPTSATKDILVFTNENQIHQHFDVIGIVSHNDPGKYQVLSVADAIPALKDKARALGADAIIIDKSEPVKSGLISTGIYVEARAIRF